MAAVIDTDAPVKSSIPHSEPIKLACDLLVLGGGGAGLTAAIKAAELSGKKVIVLEKLKKAGGCAIYAMGLRLFSTRWEAAAGIPDQMDDYIRSAMNTTRWELNPQLVANGFRSIPGFFDWLCTWASPEEAFEIKGSPFDPNKKTVDTKDREKGAGDCIMNK
ncbi:MAG: FAD-binding protein, partial [Clostridiales bacterium]|nr:FAD-binding protein [Clostridiales bacterium]